MLKFLRWVSYHVLVWEAPTKVTMARSRHALLSIFAARNVWHRGIPQRTPSCLATTSIMLHRFHGGAFNLYSKLTSLTSRSQPSNLLDGFPEAKLTRRSKNMRRNSLRVSWLARSEMEWRRLPHSHEGLLCMLDGFLIFFLGHNGSNLPRLVLLWRPILLSS